MAMSKAERQLAINSISKRLQDLDKRSRDFSTQYTTVADSEITSNLNVIGGWLVEIKKENPEMMDWFLIDFMINYPEFKKYYQEHYQKPHLQLVKQ